MMGGMASGMGAMVAGITTDAFGSITPQQGGPAAGGFAAPVPVAGIGIVQPTPAPTVPPTVPPTSTASPPDDMAVFKQKLEKIKMMHDMGMLSDEEFESQKKNLLSGL